MEHVVRADGPWGELPPSGKSGHGMPCPYGPVRRYDPHRSGRAEADSLDPDRDDTGAGPAPRPGRTAGV